MHMRWQARCMQLLPRNGPENSMMILITILSTLLAATLSDASALHLAQLRQLSQAPAATCTQNDVLSWVIKTSGNLTATPQGCKALSDESGLIEVAYPKEYLANVMFNMYPLYDKYKLRSGDVVSTPYHVYNVDGTILHGLSDLDAVTNLIKGRFVPVTHEGRALTSFWALDYKNNSVEPYKEMIVLFLVKDKVGDETSVEGSCQSLLCIPVLSGTPGYHSYVYKLWLDERIPIKYGLDILGTDKYRSEAMYTRSTEDSVSNLEFSWHNAKGFEDVVFAAKVQLQTSPAYQLQFLGPLGAELGAQALFSLLNPMPSKWSLVSPPGIANVPSTKKKNPMWEGLFVTDPLFQMVSDEDKQEIKIGGELVDLNFDPILWQWDASIACVLLNPWSYKRVSSD